MNAQSPTAPNCVKTMSNLKVLTKHQHNSVEGIQLTHRINATLHTRCHIHSVSFFSINVCIICDWLELYALYYINVGLLCLHWLCVSIILKCYCRHQFFWRMIFISYNLLAFFFSFVRPLFCRFIRSVLGNYSRADEHEILTPM